MQPTDDATGRDEAADLDADAATEQTCARLRDKFLVVAAGGAALIISLIHVLPWFIPRDADLPWLVEVLLALLLSALVSFIGAFLCALGCRRSRRLLRHAGVVLADVAIVALMYVYCPWVYFETDPPKIVYAPIWSPPLRSEMMIDGQSLLAVGRLIDQYMLVIIASSILILLLTRRPAAQVD
jgi:hypothetical protein